MDGSNRPGNLRGQSSDCEGGRPGVGDSGEVFDRCRRRSGDCKRAGLSASPCVCDLHLQCAGLLPTAGTGGLRAAASCCCDADASRCISRAGMRPAAGRYQERRPSRPSRVGAFSPSVKKSGGTEWFTQLLRAGAGFFCFHLVTNQL